jgi:hypothetical protein
MRLENTLLPRHDVSLAIAPKTPLRKLLNPIAYPENSIR